MKNKSQEVLNIKESVLEKKNEVKMFDGLDYAKLNEFEKMPDKFSSV